MPKWILLTGAPTRQQVDDSLLSSVAGVPIRGAWLDVNQPGEAAQVQSDRSLYQNDIFASEQEQDADDGQDTSEDLKTRLYHETQGLVEPSRAGEEDESQENREAETQESFDSMLPPPTQFTRAERSANQTTEQSLIHLPSWGFSLSTITPLNALPSTTKSSTSAQSRLNLLVYIQELEPPSTIMLKQPSKKTGKREVDRAAMSVFDETGVSLQIIMWDDYAEQWAGQYLKEGDIVYLEKIALSEYLGQRQGSTGVGSKVQICYRTRSTNRKRDKELRPDLELAWDPISKKVKALRETVEQLD